jgi:CRP-like cAMP-binding protein
MGKIKHKPANSVLYSMDEPENHFYLILSGQVRITGRFGMHKICETGETLL